MGKPSPPAPPDPRITAQAQTQSNLDTARAEAQLNRVNEVTPYGNVNWSTTPGVGGTPQYTRTASESQNQQALREGQEGLGIGLNQLATDQVATLGNILGTNFDPQSTTGASGFSSTGAAGGPLDLAAALGSYNAGRFDPTAQPGLDLSAYNPAQLDPLSLSRYDPTTALGDYGGDVEARTRELMSRGLDEHEARSRESVRTRLANQGIEAGSGAFDAEMRALESGLGDARARAELGAREVARGDRAQMAGELGQGAGISSAERADLLGRLATGAGLESAEGADALSRLGMGFDQYTGARGQQYSELMGGRQQRIGEAESDYSRDYAAALAERQIPLAEISSIMSGAPLQTLNPGAVSTSQVAPTNTAGIQQGYFDTLMNQYGIQQQNANATTGAAATLGATALTVF